VTPEYPGIARAAQIEGDVVVEAVVGADGSVGEVTVLRSVHPLLDEAARNAVRRYEYAPGRRNGSPEQATVRIVVSFQLQ
jgi:protein TonB